MLNVSPGWIRSEIQLELHSPFSWVLNSSAAAVDLLTILNFQWSPASAREPIIADAASAAAVHTANFPALISPPPVRPKRQPDGSGRAQDNLLQKKAEAA